MKLVGTLVLLIIFFAACAIIKPAQETERPNVLVIMVDDLNDNIGVLGGHSQAYTPNMDRFAASATRFNLAYTNAPMCGPSRASMFTGVYPHHSNNYFQAPWYKNEVLSNTRTMMEQFKASGYQVLGSGKILHHNQKELWTSFENPADYTPTPFDGESQQPHPDVPEPFSKIGWVDGSFGPFVNLEGRTAANGKPIHWTTGNKQIGFKPMSYVNDDDRDPTPDEINAKWAAMKINELDSEKSNQPFFLAVGFLRPHTPLVAPQKYFDLFPLESIQLVDIKRNDIGDTHLLAAYKGSPFTLRLGKEMFDAISEAYGSIDLGLKKWTQAYLACVAAVDENIGEVFKALESSSLKDNTIVVLASDHGFHMGEKDYLYKNSLWEESTRVPLIIRVPHNSKAGSEVNIPVSLIDVYPTLLDYCKLPYSTTKNQKGHSLDGHSLRPLIAEPSTRKWKGPSCALTVVYADDQYKDDPSMQHYAIRSDRYRYILYNNGLEELYDHKIDPNEWENISQKDEQTLSLMRNQLKKMLAPVRLHGFSKLN